MFIVILLTLDFRFGRGHAQRTREHEQNSQQADQDCVNGDGCLQMEKVGASDCGAVCVWGCLKILLWSRKLVEQNLCRKETDCGSPLCKSILSFFSLFLDRYQSLPFCP